MAPQVGFEPTTNRLTAGCSTAELLWNTSRFYIMNFNIQEYFFVKFNFFEIFLIKIE